MSSSGWSWTPRNRSPRRAQARAVRATQRGVKRKLDGLDRRLGSARGVDQARDVGLVVGRQWRPLARSSAGGAPPRSGRDRQRDVAGDGGCTPRRWHRQVPVATIHGWCATGGRGRAASRSSPTSIGRRRPTRRGRRRDRPQEYDVPCERAVAEAARVRGCGQLRGLVPTCRPRSASCRRRRLRSRPVAHRASRSLVWSVFPRPSARQHAHGVFVGAAPDVVRITMRVGDTRLWCAADWVKLAMRKAACSAWRRSARLPPVPSR